MANRTVYVTAAGAALPGWAALLSVSCPDRAPGSADVGVGYSGQAHTGERHGGVTIGDACDSNDPGDEACGEWVFVATEDGGVAAPVCVERDGFCSDGGR
jgi:hypothetical protein